jgi:hypothetical protein
LRFAALLGGLCEPAEQLKDVVVMNSCTALRWAASRVRNSRGSQPDQRCTPAAMRFDLGFIPSFADWMRAIRPLPWMGRAGRLDDRPDRAAHPAENGEPRHPSGRLQQCGDLLASLAHLGGEIAQEQLARRAGSHLSILH